MNFLIDFLKNNESYLDMISNLKSNNVPIYCNGLIKESLFHLVYSIFNDLPNKNLVLLVENDNRANELCDELKNLVGDKVVVYPNFEIRFHNINSLETNLENIRIEIMNRLISKEKFIIITSASALSKKISTPNFFKSHYIYIDENSEINLNELTENLIKMHYDRVDFVEAKGQFSIRGSIFDIFPVNFKNPIRIELFGDDVDSIRVFDINSQRSVEKLKKVEIIPAKEMVLSKADVENILNGLNKDIEKLQKLKLFGKDIEKSTEKFYQIYNDLKENYHISNMDLISPYIRKGSYSTLLDYLDKDSIVCTEDILKIYDRNLEIENLFHENVVFSIENAEILDSHKDILIPFENILRRIKEFSVINFTQLLKRTKIINPKSIVNLKTIESEIFNRKFDMLFQSLKYKLQRGYKIVIFAGSFEKANNLKEILFAENINSNIFQGLEFELKSSILGISTLNLESGFEYPIQKVLFLTHKEIYGTVKKTSKKVKKKSKDTLLDYTDLNVGDFVVHENHGIGEYRGIQQIETDGIVKDHILILYKGNDKLYIPTDQMNLIQKYIGKDGYKPKLNKLGSNDWIKTKTRAKKVLDEIAIDLVQLYAKRDKIRGFAFSEDTTWQKEFEDSFIYEETYSQLRAINEIKKDMEQFKPMDRLLCGDVGYGKTEVALRAAFKAMMDDKQVAFLVPTTILAQQTWQADNFGDPLTEGRLQTLEFDFFYLVNVYTPNSKRELQRLNLRQQIWDPNFLSYLKYLERTKPVIVCGDFNAAHTEIDLARPKDNHKNAGFTDEERQGITNLIQAGFVDTFRTLHPDQQRYSWWSHWAKARERNIGWRIDYFFISQALLPNLKTAEIHEKILGSDHCPISIELEF